MAFMFFVLPVMLIALAIFAGLILLILIGAGILTLGVGGSIAASTAVKDRQIKKVLILVSVAVILMGITCVSPLLLMADVPFRTLALCVSIANIGTVLLGVKGIVDAVKLEQKAIKVILSIVSCLGFFLSIASLLFSFLAV